MTRDLAAQWTSRRGIRVNAVVPGFFPSEMTDQYPEGYVAGRVPGIPAQRPGEPDELAAVVVFLASGAASYVTGTSIAVDGGLIIS